MKKNLISGLLIVAILAVGTMILASAVRADSDSAKGNNGERNNAGDLTAKSAPAMILEVNKNGKIILRGTLESAGSSSLAVKSWGGVWMINISSATQVLPASDTSKFKAGDFIGVHGFVNKDALWTINASTVRDWDAVQAVGSQAKENKKEAKALIKASASRNWQGVASNVNASGNSLTLTVDNVSYTVNLASGAKLYNRNWLTMNFSDVKNRDTIRVWGPVVSSTISALVLRDISVPVKSNSDKGGH